MDYLLLSLGIVLILLGLIGCILPIIPGPPLSFGGILAIHYTKFADFSQDFLYIAGFFAIFITVLDYIVPVWGTKKFGGTKWGIRGATIGLLVGIIFMGPAGILLGPLLGAFIGEYLNKDDFNRALKSALGSILGFLMGVGLKLIASGTMTYFFVKELVI